MTLKEAEELADQTRRRILWHTNRASDNLMNGHFVDAQKMWNVARELSEEYGREMAYARGLREGLKANSKAKKK